MNVKELYEIYSILREDYSDVELADAIIEHEADVDSDILDVLDDYDLTEEELRYIATEFCNGVSYTPDYGTAFDYLLQNGTAFDR